MLRKPVFATYLYGFCIYDYGKNVLKRLLKRVGRRKKEGMLSGVTGEIKGDESYTKLRGQVLDASLYEEELRNSFVSTT